MRLPGERFGSMFTRFKYDSPFHFVSIVGGLEFQVRVIKNGVIAYGVDDTIYRRINELFDDLRELSINRVHQVLSTKDEIIIDDLDIDSVELSNERLSHEAQTCDAMVDEPQVMTLMIPDISAGDSL